MPRRQCWPSLRQPPRKSCWRLSVLSEQPTAIAAAGVRSHCSGMGGHTKVLCAARPCLFRRLRTHPKGLRFSAVPTPVPKPGSCFHLFRDSDHRLVKRGWQSQKVGGELREFLRGQGEEFRLPARQITGVIHIETMTQVTSERNRFDRLIKPFGCLLQLLIIYPG